MAVTAFLQFTPLSPNYQAEFAQNNIITKLDGGRSRIRRDIVGGNNVIQANWILDRNEYTRFSGFVRERIKDATLDFFVNLLTDVNLVMPHVARFLSKPKLTSQSGDAFYVSGAMEVVPNPTLSFNMLLIGGQVTNAGDADTVAPNMDAFPVGREVILTGTRQTESTWGGVFINVDGQYVIASKPAVFTLQLASFAAVNPAWTTLAGLSPPSYFPTAGACILVPDGT